MANEGFVEPRLYGIERPGDRVLSAYRDLGRSRETAMQQAQAQAYGQRGLGAGLQAMVDVEQVSQERRAEIDDAMLRQQNKRTWADFTNYMRDRSTADHLGRRIALNYGSGLGAAILGSTKGPDAKAFESAIGPVRREPDETARRLAYAAEIEKTVEGMPEDVPIAAAAGTAEASLGAQFGQRGVLVGGERVLAKAPPLQEPFREWIKRPIGIGGGGAAAPAAAPVSEFSGILQRPGDPFQYAKAGDLWMARRGSAGTWTALPQAAVAELEALLAAR